MYLRFIPKPPLDGLVNTFLDLIQTRFTKGRKKLSRLPSKDITILQVKTYVVTPLEGKSYTTSFTVGVMSSTVSIMT